MRSKFYLQLARFMQDESGQDMIEYALVVAIIALGSVASMSTLAGSISTAYNSIGTTFTTAV